MGKSDGDRPDQNRPDIDDGWTPVDDCAPPMEQLEFEDLTLLTEVTHELRSRILRRLKEPRTVAQLAADLDVPVTRLYHHVNRLESRGLIHVVATRQVAAVTERRYQVVALSFRIGSELLESQDPREMALAFGSLFDVAKMGLQREVENGAYQGVTDADSHSILSLGEIHLTEGRRRELVHRLTEIISEFTSDADPDAPDTTRMTLFVAAFPEAR